MEFVIKSENGGKYPWRIADRDGDPGRTCLLGNAKIFADRDEAIKEMEKIIRKTKHRPWLYRNLRVIER